MMRPKMSIVSDVLFTRKVSNSLDLAERADMLSSSAEQLMRGKLVSPAAAQAFVDWVAHATGSPAEWQEFFEFEIAPAGTS